MTDLHVSPISQLLHTLGITREDLMKRSDQMRQFLTTDDAISSRVFEPRSGSDTLPNPKSAGPSRSFARSLSRASSSSLREGTPPTTPVKSEPHEIQLPHRRMDSMEMIIERQRRQRKSRKGRERESSRNRHHPPSPSPSNASSGFGVKPTQVRDDPKRTNSTEVQKTPTENNTEQNVVTTPINKYYREHTNLSMQPQPSRESAGNRNETPTPTRPVVPQALGPSVPPYYAYPALAGYQHYLPMAYRAMQAGSSAVPITPQANRTQPGKSPLPPSSPPPAASSPVSSPARRVVNLVSSPGPMGPDPRENEYDDLPYRLPPGPYLSTKPDLSYAALIGRAILSSPEHRLTLQEIYDWITIVYPYYKRGETTWMNSIRHVLSTTVVFRKVPRDRSVGRTLWAIYNEDLECFKDGGFKKYLCKDYANDGKGKGKTRKRTEDDDTVRKPKKAKKEVTSGGHSTESNIVHSSFLGRNTPLFPCVRPTPHLQPYYQSCLPQSLFPTVPADIIFPPLPASAALSRIVNASDASSTSLASTAMTGDASSTESNSSTPPTSLSRSSPPVSSTASSSSVPELTPNRNSSSPSSMPATSDIDVNMHDAQPPSGGIYRALHSDSQNEPALESASVDVDAASIFNAALLDPVNFWKDSSKKSSALQRGRDLFNGESEAEDSSAQDRKGKKKIETLCRPRAFPPVPTSPTLCLRAKRSKSDGVEHPSATLLSVSEPSTPPRTYHQISSIRTPLSHIGVKMSPASSLAHYKSNLDPPPVVNSGIVPLEVSHRIPNAEEEVDPMKTPRKRLNLSNTPSIFGCPMTPKRLNFSAMSDSPFRTPHMRAVYDPIDPRSVLDDELNRINEESPAGLYGKERSTLLYDSPGLEGFKWW